MADDTDPVIETVTKEIKAMGDDVKKLRDSMHTDLDKVRKLAEDTKTDAADEIKKLSESINLKNEAIEKKAQERIDELEKKLNRPRVKETSDAETKSVEDFHLASLSIKGQLKVGKVREEVSPDDVKAYSKTMDLYLRRDKEVLDSNDMKTMLVGSDPDGGYLVTPKIATRVMQVLWETSPMRQLATVETISTDAIEYPIDDGEFGAGWVGETEDRPETATSRMGVQRIVVNEIYAMPKVTQKLLEDAAVDVEAWVANKIAQKFARMEASAFIVGDGIKKPRGILSYPAATIGASGFVTRGTVEQISSGSAGVITSDALVTTSFSLKEPYAANASWLMRRASVPAIMLLKDTQGRYIWSPGLTNGVPSSLMGYPINHAADMPAVASGSLSVAFGDWGQAYTIVDRLGITTLRDPYTAKPFVLFYTRKRVGGDVTNFEAYKVIKTV